MTHLISRFLKDRHGNFGIILGLSLLPIVSTMGAAVDYSSLYNRKSKIQAAADTAIIAAANDAATVNQFGDLANAYLSANLPDLELEVEPKTGPRSVSLQVHNRYQTTFLAMAGISEIEIEVEAEVAIEKFGRGSTGNRPASGNNASKGKPANGETVDAEEIAEALEALRRQMLRDVNKLPYRKQAEMRSRINRKFDAWVRRAKAEARSASAYISK